MIPTLKQNPPGITTPQMIEVDRLMTKEYQIDLPRMMENAGLNLALLAKEVFLDSNAQDKKVVVLAGPGGNGGGVMVAARRLMNWGVNVSLVLSTEIEKLTPVPAKQFEILGKIGIELCEDIPSKADLIIDGVIGYSIKGNPRGKAKVMIEAANASSVPVLSLDTPSGLDLTTGTPAEPCIRAAATLTLAMPKQGLFTTAAKSYVGDLYLADISVPPQLYGVFGMDIKEIRKIFSESTIVKIKE
ncbi:MAG: NAD(P)H-hydrate epimerase [Chlorobi bacterium]|nr:NAD(P)H-hydrate epimerase [Chlorobiota bacterium]